MTRVDYFGKKAYGAYCSETNNKSLITGCELPNWDELPLKIQDAWIAASDAVLDAYSNRGWCEK